LTEYKTLTKSSKLGCILYIKWKYIIGLGWAILRHGGWFFLLNCFCQIISEYVGIRVFHKFRTKMTKNSQYWQTLVSKAKKCDYEQSTACIIITYFCGLIYWYCLSSNESVKAPFLIKLAGSATFWLFSSKYECNVGVAGSE